LRRAPYWHNFLENSASGVAFCLAFYESNYYKKLQPGLAIFSADRLLMVGRVDFQPFGDRPSLRS
jgi:hypothetical protein